MIAQLAIEYDELEVVKMMNFAFKMMNFALMMMSFAFKW